MTKTSTQQEKRKILQMVADGQISPEEGAALLEAVGNQTTHDRHDRPVRSVKVIGTFRSLTVEGDPTIQGAVAEGPHTVREEAGSLIFEDDPDQDDSFILFGPNRRRRGVSIKINDRRFTLGEHSGPAQPPALRIRMNPALPLELNLTAGTARVTNLTAHVKVAIAAGAARLENLTEPFDVDVDAGSVNISCKLDHGDSHVRCTAGKVRVELDPSSDVKVIARSTLGKLVLPDLGQSEPQRSGIGGGKREVTIGSGAASLDVEATTGAIVVELAQ